MQNTDTGFNVPSRLIKETPRNIDREKKQQARSKSKAAPKAKGGVAGGEVQHFLKAINEDTPDEWEKAPIKEAPDMTWEIDHVYGYSGDRNKSCLYFGQNNNEIIYPTAALGVVQDLTTGK